MKKETAPAFDRLRRLAGQAVCRYRMIQDGDRILLGLSGGKDSLTLAHVLGALQKRAPVHFDVFLGVFDPGFPGFGLEALREYARNRNWRLEEIRTDVASLLDPEKSRVLPCVLCSRIRRGKLAFLARKLRCNKLALGQHLDDILASFLMSFVRGQGISTMGPCVPSDSEEGLQIIRPLALAEEALILQAAEELGPYPVSGQCPYKDLLADGDRAYFRNLVDTLAKKIPHAREQMLHSLTKVETRHLLDTRFLKNT